MRRLVYMILLFSVITGCLADRNLQNVLVGNWSCGVQREDFEGKEIISISDDKSFAMIDQGCYSYAEGDVRIEVECKIVTRGEWRLRDEILEIELSSPEVKLDTLSMRIFTTNPKVIIDSLSSDYALLRVALCDKLNSIICNEFSAQSGKALELGKVSLENPQTLTISKNGGTIILNKID